MSASAFTSSQLLLKAPQPRALFPAPSSESFAVVIVYEDGVAGRQAKELVDRVVPHAEISLELCRFDALILPEVFSRTSEAAATADLIVFATYSNGELPLPVRSWVAHWAMMRDESRPGALTALCTCPPDALSGAPLGPNYLRAIAELTGLEYFVPDAIMALPQFTPVPPYEHIAEQPRAMTPMLASAVRYPDEPACSRWGINE